MPFADKLKLLRQMKNVSQKELSIATNISGASISSYEKGTKSPTLENVVKLADYFDISIDAIVDRHSANNGQNPTTIGEFIPLYITLLDYFSFNYCEKPFPHMWTEDENICKFISDCNNLYLLLKAGTIKQDLFDLWINEQAKKYSTELSTKRK